MKPDFLITQRSSTEGVIYVVTPTNTPALNWMFAHVRMAERGSLSAHLSFDRLAQFKSDAAIAGMKISQPQASPPQQEIQTEFAGMGPASDPSVHARNVLLGRSGPWVPTRLQCEVVKQLLLHQGAQNAIALRDLMGKLQRTCTPAPNERQIKEAARSLVVDFKVRIGASRSEPVGYFLITSVQEARETARPYIAEIRELARRVRVLLDPHDLADMAGQQWLTALLSEPEPEPPKEAA